MSLFRLATLLKYPIRYENNKYLIAWMRFLQYPASVLYDQCVNIYFVGKYNIWKTGEGEYLNIENWILCLYAKNHKIYFSLDAFFRKMNCSYSYQNIFEKQQQKKPHMETTLGNLRT